MTDDEMAEVLTDLVRSPLIRQMLKDASPFMTDELIDRLRIVPRTREDEPNGDFDA